MENLLTQNIFNKNRRYAGDQELYAYLFNDLEYYHPRDFKRSRVGSIYDLEDESCAALHFVGKMRQPHINQINRISNSKDKKSVDVSLVPPVPFSLFEFFRMKLQIKLGESKLLAKPLNIFRKLLRPYR